MASTADSPTAPPTLWRHPDFMKLWIGQTISLFGSQFTQLGLPLIAVITLKANPVEMGILGAMTSTPFLLFGLFAGVWVDRWRKRPILITADICRGLLLATIPLGYLLGVRSMLHLYVVSLLVGICTLFFDIAYQSFLPVLIERSQLVEGNSKLEVSRSSAQVTGPGIAGTIIQALSPPPAIILDTISFLISAIFLTSIRKPEPEPAASTRAPMLPQIREGIGVVFRNPYLRAIAGCTTTSSFFGAIVSALFILFMTNELKFSPPMIGIVTGLGNVGALIAALTAARLAARFGVGQMILAGILIHGLGGVAIAFAPVSTPIPFVMAGWFLLVLGLVIYTINQVSLRQAVVPQQMLGRMNATMRFMIWGCIPLGSLIGGAIGQLYTLRTGVAVGAIGDLLLPFLWLLASPVVALKRISDLEPPQEETGAE